MLQEGDDAPDFTIPSSGGGEVALSTLRRKWVVLYFYPRDLTPGCTREAEAFRDAAGKLRKLHAVVVGVSKDSIASHEKFVDKCGLNFPLASDATGQVIKAYGAWGKKNLYGKVSEGIVRTTVLIDPEGKVARIFPKVKVEGHADEVIAAIQEAKK